ncbi:MAG: bifunctional metallophosphatase/5'-nucleotidase [Fibrobacter sp.]|nr:bifunctional metallophosphatase/5'-nucleotidase [Fibrobacter sp.]
MRKLLWLIIICAVLANIAFAGPDIAATCDVAGANDVAILFTNDVHCGVTENIGYSGLAAYKDSLQHAAGSVILADVGDAIQGNFMGTLSKGGIIVELMNAVGYDVATLGNHEFDYGMPRLAELLDSSRATYVAANLRYTGAGENPLKKLLPYKMVETTVGKVAFVGVVTPESYFSSTPTNFQENGKIVYQFKENNDAKGRKFYKSIQKTVDECKKQGADFVVLLTHMGVASVSAPYRSLDLIANLAGVDVVLDGHSHSVIPGDWVKDKKGKPVLLASTGTKLESIGQVVLAKDKKPCSKLVSDYKGRCPRIDSLTLRINEKFQNLLKEKIAVSEVAMPVTDAAGVRLPRVREHPLGNLIADGIRTQFDVDVAFMNGGNVRADLPKGDVTYGDALAMMPFGSWICIAEVSGQTLLDALEFSYRAVAATNTSATPASSVQPISLESQELGGFLQVSGLRLTVDTSKEPSLELDSLGAFARVKGPRRVRDVQVLQKDGSYKPLDPKKLYRVASVEFILMNGGDGYTMFSKGKVVAKGLAIDADVFANYLKNSLHGVVPADLGETKGRINIQ